MRQDIPLKATVRELFDEFMRETVGEIDPMSFAYLELEKAFYSGFAAMLGLVWTMANETRDNRELRKQTLQALNEELCAFARKMVAEAEEDQK